MKRLPLRQVVERLCRQYGRPKPPAVIDPWLLILWENIAYLVHDERRQAAFLKLQERMGTRPEDILSVTSASLLEVAQLGILPEQRVEKLRHCAEIALKEFDGDLRPVLKWPLAKAKKALASFPGIGEPGAEKILLFARAYPVLALESNGLRVLVRLGFAEESKNYSTTYRRVRKAVEQERSSEYSWLIAAHQLLRRHGQELCRRTRPLCPVCPLAPECSYYRGREAGSP